jgi:PAS domain S-box-containing protein
VTDRRLLLVAETGDGARAIMKHLLAAYGEAFTQCVSTLPALVEALREPWTAVLIDMDTAVLDALEGLQVVQSADPLLPVIMLSGSVSEEATVAAMKAGARDFVGKSHLERLRPAIDSALREASSRKEAVRNEARFRATFEQSAVGIVHGSLNGHILRANARFAHLLGRSAEELIGKSLQDLTYPGDPFFDGARLKGLKDGQPVSFEKRYLHKDGSPVWLHITLGLAESEFEDEPYVIGITQEISARKLAEQQLRESETLYRELMEQASEAIFLTDRDLRYCDVNTRACELTGYTREQLLQMNANDLILPGTSELNRENVSGGRTAHSERVLRRADGTTVEVELSAKVLSDGRFQGIVTDITERKRSAERLRSSEERFRLVVSATNDAIFDLDLGTGSFWFNDRYRELIGDPPDEADARMEWWRQHIHPEDRDRVMAQLVEHVGSGLLTNDEFRWIRDDGTTLNLLERRLTVPSCSGLDTRLIGTLSDLTEQRRAEQGVRASEERFRLVAAATNDAIFDWNVQEGLIWVNDRMREMFGEPPVRVDEHIAWWMDRIYPEDRNRAIGHRLEGLFGEGAFEPCEYRITRESDGKVVSVLERTFVRRTPQGKTIRVVGTMTELTEIRAAQSALSMSEAKFMRLFETGAVGISFWRHDGTVVDANEAYLSIIGFDRQDLESERVNWKTISSESSAEAIAQAGEALRVSGTAAPFRKHYVRKDGSEVPVLVTPSLLEGENYDGVSVVVDITEQEAAVEALRHNEERLRLLIENGHDIITVLEPDGTILYVSSSVERVLGYAPEELVGRNTFDWMHPEDAERVVAVLSDGIVGGLQTGEAEYRYRARDGSWRWLESVGRNLLTTRGVKGIVINSRDVTERRAWQKRLEQAERLGSLGRLAATVAHEFNNVLMGIQPFAEVLRRRLADDERAVSACNHIETSVKRGRRITQEILRFTQAAEPTLTPVNVGDWLQEMSTELRGLLPETVQLVVIGPVRKTIMLADRLQLTQAVSNLVLNARDAMPGGGVITLGTESDLPGTAIDTREIVDPAAFVHLSVRDEGGGIPPGMQQQIFEPLFTTKRSGTGLGLPIVHQIVTRHGGHVFVESEQGRGTIFHLLIPRTLREDLEGEDSSSNRELTEPGTHGARVLLVEDEIAVAEGLTALLEIEGFVVHAVHRGLEAEAAIVSFIPDVVVLDVGLPDINGVDLYRSLSKSYGLMPFIFSTGHGDAVEIGEVNERVRFLHKPYTSEAILEVLGELLNLR